MGLPVCRGTTHFALSCRMSVVCYCHNANRSRALWPDRTTVFGTEGWGYESLRAR